MMKFPAWSSMVPVKVLPVGIMLLSSSRTVISVPCTKGPFWTFPLRVMAEELEVSVVVVLSVLVVPDEPLSLLQEIMVKLRNEIRIMYKTFFIFFPISKVKYYGWMY